MQTTLLFVTAFGARASVALAASLPPVEGANENATAELRPAGPVALTEAEMDQVAAGAGLGGGRTVSFSVADDDHTAVTQKRWSPSNFRLSIDGLD